jgi:hypothetical protein
MASRSGGAWLFAALVMIGGAATMAAKKKAPKKAAGGKASGVVSSLDELLPPFRAKVLELLELVRADGFDPVVFETWRGPARTAELAERGTGAAKSLHGYRVAADIISDEHHWTPPAAFWASLHKHALALKLGRVMHREADGVARIDLPHVQALPGQFDNTLRRLDDAARTAFLAQRYGAPAVS